MFPTDEEPAISVPAVVTGSRVPEIDEESLKSAMKDVGLTRLTVKKWKAQRTIGAALEQIGAVQVSAGDYVISNHLRDEVVRLLRRKLKQNGATIEQIALLAKVMNDILIARDVATRDILRCVQTGLVKDEPKPAAGTAMAPKGTNIVFAQINQSVTNPAPSG